MNKIGQVIAVDNDYVWVDVSRQAACQSCAMKSGCGQRALESLSKNTATVKVAHPAFDVSIGDTLDVALPDDSIVKVSMLMYGLPVISMLIVAATVNSFYPGDLAAMLGALVGFLIGASAMRLYDRFKGSDLAQNIVVKTAQID